ncbi:MAG: peptide chain release factor 1 [Clostridia bacterium]|nr:peptide chain release factor 1 [Clostridia bacterium]MBQ8399078.1 peptide chain release factor 1 [Clostridia bacterium]
MIEKLRKAAERYEQLGDLLGGGQVAPGSAQYKELMKEYSDMSALIAKYEEYKEATSRIDEALELLEMGDKELAELAKEDLKDAKERKSVLEEEIRLLLIPPDPMDGKNVVVEIRACAGGEEAALFAADLFRMYGMYADKMGYKTERMSENPTELGGYREIDFLVSGQGAYSHFKFESGVHRVQRVPETESQGRIQTSTVSVAVLPEADEVEVHIDPSDITIESCKSSGAGGQHINKTESAVRLTHKPSGIVIECDEERSQFKNKDKALKLLRTRLYDMKMREQQESIAGQRREQVGTGDRSERIRTYNYPQGRITDHRIGLTLYTLTAQLDGDLDPLIRALASEEAARKLTEE